MLLKDYKDRDYQNLAHRQIVALFKESMKLLLVMPTGSGKSKTAVSFIRKHLRHFNWVIAVRTCELVEQLADDFKFFQLPYSVLMADDKRYDETKSIQICSIDTMQARGIYPHLHAKKDVVFIIDEADQSNAEQYQVPIDLYTTRSKLSPLNGKRNGFLLGMTATPYNAEGLSHFDEYIKPITAKELRDSGVLVEYDNIIPKGSIDLKDVPIVNGEFVQKAIKEKLDTPNMINQSRQY